MFIKNLLTYCGFPAGLRGYDIFSACIHAGCEDEDKLLVYKNLYLEMEPLFHLTPKAMDRDMRTILDYVWDHCDYEPLRKIAGCSLFYEEPKVTEVIDFFVCYVNDHSPKSQNQNQ